MNTERLYVFVTEDNKVIAQVRARNHDHAVRVANTHSAVERVKWNTEFYTVED